MWPASRALRLRIAAAVVSLLAAKCLTIAAPVALAGLIDYFTQLTAAEVAAGITTGGAASAAAGATAEGAAAGTAGVAGAAGGGAAAGSLLPVGLLHPALPLGLVISYPLARLGASGRTLVG